MRRTSTLTHDRSYAAYWNSNAVTQVRVRRRMSRGWWFITGLMCGAAVQGVVILGAAVWGSWVG